MAVEIRPKQSSLAVKVERNDHSTLTHRNDPDQHKIDAITGLSDALNNLNDLITGVKENVDSNDVSTSESIENLAASIELLATNLTDLINNLVKTERERAIEKEESIDVKFTGEINNLRVDTEKETKRLDQNVVALGNELSARVNELQAVEYDLNVKIDDEVLRARKAEIELDDKIKEETARAQSGEEKLYDLLSIETNRAINQEKVLTQNLEAETRRALEAEDNLATDIADNMAKTLKIQDSLTDKILKEKERAEAEEIKLDNKINTETKRAIEAEANLQNYIDSHIAEVNLRTDVIDIVATKTELDSYNKSSITENDIVKVLSDESSFNATTYYRLIEGDFRLVGSTGPYYTTAEINEQTRYLRDENINFAGTKAFSHITSEQIPQTDIDLTNKLYVDTSITAEKDRATEAEKLINDTLSSETSRATAAENALANSITELNTELTTKLGAKADLVDGKIPNSQLPESHKTTSIFEYESIEKFPETGLEGSLYISVSDNVIYRWTGAEYVALSSAGFKEDTTINIICEV